MQSPSHPGITYMNQHGINDVMRLPVIKMWNLPITHNKSSTRWKNVRYFPDACICAPKCDSFRESHAQCSL